MRDKLQLTRALVEQLPQTISLEQAMNTWWCNLRQHGGMRLTDAGHQALSVELALDNYRIDIDQKKFNRRMLLDLDRKLQCPYYLSTDKKKTTINMTLYGSREAVLANLYGDISRFLEMYAQGHHDR